MKTSDSHHLLPRHRFLSCCPGWWWHMQLAMFSQLALHTSKGHRGVPFTVRGKNPLLGKAKSVCRCVKWWGALRWSSMTLRCTSSACLCVFIQYVCVCLCVWSGGRPEAVISAFSLACACMYACECVHCSCEWWVLRGGHRGLPCRAWPVSSAGKQNAKCHAVKEREAKKKVCSSCQRELVYPVQRVTHEWKT